MHKLPPSLNRKQSRRIDQVAIEEYGFSGLVLMENAGRNCAQSITTHFGVAECAPGVVIACGPGNNGGDGYVIARHLRIHGFASKIILFCDPNQQQGDAAANFQIATKMDIPIERFQDSWSETQLQNCCSTIREKKVAVFVDAMLGTGATGNPRPPFDRVIPIVNQLPITRVAIDIPSGLDCDTGIPNQPTFAADETLTMVAPKKGFANDSAKNYTGEVKVIGIGIPNEILALVRST